MTVIQLYKALPQGAVKPQPPDVGIEPGPLLTFDSTCTHTLLF